jgi:hypothetical protein
MIRAEGLSWIEGVAELVKKTPNSSKHDVAPGLGAEGINWELQSWKTPNSSKHTQHQE